MPLAISQAVILNRERVPHPVNPVTEPSFSIVSAGKSLVKTTPVTPQVRCCNHHSALYIQRMRGRAGEVSSDKLHLHI